MTILRDHLILNSNGRVFPRKYDVHFIPNKEAEYDLYYNGHYSAYGGLVTLFALESELHSLSEDILGP